MEMLVGLSGATLDGGEQTVGQSADEHLRTEKVGVCQLLCSAMTAISVRR